MRSRRALYGAALGGFAVVLVATLAGIWLGGHPTDLPALVRGGFWQTRTTEPVTAEALSILTRRFYRPVNRSSLVDQGLSGMVASLDDPYSHYIDPEAYRASQEDENRPTVGIGITAEQEPRGLRVVEVIDGSPAARAGLQRDDVIVKVGHVSLVNAPADLGPGLIRGRAGTEVTLTFRRDGTEHVVSITRAPVTVPVVVGRSLTHAHVRIGYLRLRTFSEDAGGKLRGEVEKALRAHDRALILDLRGNGGGLINEAIDVASIFLSRGTIMTAVERGQPRRVYTAAGDAIAPHIPMVVLVDHGTASSSEIVAAALQEHHRARVVGMQTYGKGTFQQTQRLRNGGALDITIGQFFTPDGSNLGGGLGQRAGITPNVRVADDASPDQALVAAERAVAAEVP